MRRLATLLVVLLALPATASAQRSGTRGFFLALGIGGSTIKTDEINSTSQSGAGSTLSIGYGFTQKFALILEGTGAAISDDDNGDYTLSHGDLLARLTFAKPEKKWIPYIEAGFGSRMAAPDDVDFTDENGVRRTGELEISGTDFSLGGGVLMFFNPHWALNGNLKWSSGEFSTIKVNNVSISGFELDATSMRFGFGVSWFPRSTK